MICGFIGRTSKQNDAHEIDCNICCTRSQIKNYGGTYKTAVNLSQFTAVFLHTGKPDNPSD